VARTYAGVLGPLAFLVFVARGMLHAWPIEKTLLMGWVSLLVFSLLGMVIGWIAQRTVDDEVRGRIAAGDDGGQPNAQTTKTA
jgi:hypothetical protein